MNSKSDSQFLSKIFIAEYYIFSYSIYTISKLETDFIEFILDLTFKL